MVKILRRKVTKIISWGTKFPCFSFPEMPQLKFLQVKAVGGKAGKIN